MITYIIPNYPLQKLIENMGPKSMSWLKQRPNRVCGGGSICGEERIMKGREWESVSDVAFRLGSGLGIYIL